MRASHKQTAWDAAAHPAHRQTAPDTDLGLVGDMSPERERTVARFRKTCELAQGFCIVPFILCAVWLLGAGMRVWQVAAGPDDDWGGSSSRFKRLYVCADPTIGYQSSPFAAGPMVFGGSEAKTHWPENGKTSHPLTRSDDEVRIRSDTPIVFIVGTGSFALLAGSALYMGARFFRRVAVSGQPFRPERARELALAGKLVLALSCVPYLLVFAALKIGIALGPQYDVGVQYGFCNYLLIAFGVLLLAVAKVFEYGCVLQQQDDELV